MSTPKATASRPCSLCGKMIQPARLQALPGVATCIDCSRNNPPRIDWQQYDLSEASPINRNGFAPKD